MKDIHRYDITCQRLDDSNLSIAEFASHINRNRTTFMIFSRESVWRWGCYWIYRTYQDITFRRRCI